MGTWQASLPVPMETEACLCQDILDSIKECLWHKQIPAQTGEELGQSPVSIPRANPQADYGTRNCANYDRFGDMMQGSCAEALAVVRDTHWQALAAMVLLEDKIVRLSHSLGCGCQCSGSCRHSGSHW